MKNQTLTITLSGKGELLDADSVVTAVDSLISLLKHVDANSWRVGTERYKWNVVSASMQSPFTLTVEGISRNTEVQDFDVVGTAYDGLLLLDSEQAPRPGPFDDRCLSDAKRLVSVYRDSITDIKINATGKAKDLHPSIRVGKNVDQINEKTKASDYESYGSVDGKLRQVTVDEREGHRANSLEIIDRLTDGVVKCKVTPEQAEKLGKHIRKRVVLYGTIRRNGDHVPTNITVEAFDEIAESAAASLEDIHRAGIKFRLGIDHADTVDEMRGHAE